MQTRSRPAPLPACLLWLALLAGCSSAPQVLEVQAGPAVEYTLELLGTDEPALRVTLEAPAGPSGECVLSLCEEDDSFPPDLRDFSALSAFGADGRALEVEPLEGRLGRWRVRAAPGERITARWETRDFGRDDGTDQRECYRPLVSPRFVHVIGTRGLLAPEHVGDEELDLALTWRGFAERGWNVACSFGDDPRGVRVRRPLDEFRNALFVASPLPFHRREVAGHQLTVAPLGEDWKLDPSAFADLCAKIVGAERDFFSDHAYPHFLITAVPTGKPDPESFSLGGTGLTDAFALFFQRGSDLDPDGRLHAQVVRVLAHEMMHNWCGRWTPSEQPERLVYWFTEGFTEFLTRRLLLRAGLIDREGYARSLEESVREYLANPHHDAPNARIEAEFWQSPEVGQLPYRRGDLVAALLDRAIRERSQGKLSLDDFVREAVALGRGGERISTGTLFERIERWTDAAFAAAVRPIVEDGAPLELPADLFAPCLEITTAEEPSLELGFDFDASVASGKLSGVLPGSAAEQAGVREGQRLASISYERRVGRPVRLEVIEEGERRAIEFLPHGPVRTMPAIRVASGLGCDVL